MSLIKKLAGETAIYGVSSILSRLLNWIVLTPYFTRTFAPGEYGIVSDLYFWIALLLVIYTYRMETTFFRFGRQRPEMGITFSTASISLLASTLIFTALLFALAGPIANWLQYPDHPEYVRWFVGIVALDALMALPFARLRLENRPLRFALLKTGSIVINIFFVFFFLEWCPRLIAGGWDWIGKIYNPDNRILYVFVANFLASGFILLLLVPMYFKTEFQAPATGEVLDAPESTDKKVLFDQKLWRRMMAYALPLVVAGVAGIVNSLIGIPMLRFLDSDAAAGIFAAATKLAVLMNLFTQAFNYAAEPFFFRNADRTDAKEIYAQVAQAFAIVGSVVFLGIMLYLDVIQYFLGEDFREGLGILPIMLVANLFLGLYYSLSIWFKLSDHTHIGGYIAVGGSLVTLLINYIFIPDAAVGYYAPAWAALACYGFMLVACYLLGQRYFPIAYPVGRMLVIIILAIGLYGFSAWMQTHWTEGYIQGIAFNTLLFLTYLFIVLRIEKRFIRQIFYGEAI